MKVDKDNEYLVDLLARVDDEGTSHHQDSTSGETFQECLLCGEWDGHTPECPMPAIDKYLRAMHPDAPLQQRPPIF